MTLLTLFHKVVSSSSVLNVATRFRQGSYYDILVMSHSGIRYYWPLYEANGIVMHDIISETTGTYYNTPSLGQASLLTTDHEASVRFTSASSEFANTFVGGTVPVTFPRGTLEFWFKPVAVPATLGSGNSYIVANSVFKMVWDSAVSQAQGGMYVTLTDGTHAYDGGIIDGTPPSYTTTVAHHAVMSFDGSNANFFVDGVGVYSTSVSASSFAAFDDLLLASNDPISTLNYFNGTIQKVALYDEPLTPAEVIAHYQAGSNRFRIVRTRFRLSSPITYRHVLTRFRLQSYTFKGVLGRFHLSAPVVIPPIYLDGEFSSSVNLEGEFTSTVSLDGEFPGDHSLSGEY